MVIFLTLIYVHHNRMAHLKTFLSDFSNYSGYVHYILNLKKQHLFFSYNKPASLTYIYNFTLYSWKLKKITTVKRRYKIYSGYKTKELKVHGIEVLLHSLLVCILSVHCITSVYVMSTVLHLYF